MYRFEVSQKVRKFVRFFWPLIRGWVRFRDNIRSTLWSEESGSRRIFFRYFGRAQKLSDIGFFVLLWLISLYFVTTTCQLIHPSVFFLLTKKPAWLSEFPRSSAAESFSHRSMKRNNQAHPLSHPAWKKHDGNWEPGFFFGLGRSTGEFLAAFVFKDIWRIMYIDRYLVAHISYIYIYIYAKYFLYAGFLRSAGVPPGRKIFPAGGHFQRADRTGSLGCHGAPPWLKASKKNMAVKIGMRLDNTRGVLEKNT